ncbi:unnamed protein product [Strongylus vulgaris]|uniref:Uncharacterized protein n=1 Tax=Strongylus vulgaris TaxID=40348 RepID=A0A3P7JDS2_STRVU|nr:unnamed protein product [Strongylus vulgaris]
MPNNYDYNNHNYHNNNYDYDYDKPDYWYSISPKITYKTDCETEDYRKVSNRIKGCGSLSKQFSK